MSGSLRAHTALIDTMAVFAAHTDHGFTERVGGATAIVTGLPHHVFNFVTTTPAATPDDLHVATIAAAESGHPWCVMLRRDEDAGHLRAVEEMGLVRDDESSPLMATADPTEVPWPDELELVSGAWTLPMHRALLCDAFDLDEALVEPLATEALGAALGVTTVVGMLNGLPVTTAMGVHVGDAVGVFSVGTTASVRGRGYGAAITWASMQPAFNARASIAVLQTSPMGQSVYESMGFEVVAVHDRWTATA